ncbi:MAG: hypothetical protein ACLRHQ_03175 [Sellimonas intestinalis]|uniref:hypothetical protein n=1 Tax=Sellimonas intestinalis TaxID=1653434 RepID=UPI0039A1384F
MELHIIKSQPIMEARNRTSGFGLHWIWRKGKLEAAVWKEPYCYDVTPEEEIERKEFPADDEGLCQITDWINEKAK